jgi:hypothetical protein
MDPTFDGLPDFTNGFLFKDQTISPNSNLVPEYNSYVSSPDLNFLDNSFLPPGLGTADFDVPVAANVAAADQSLSPPSTGTSLGGDLSSDDSEFSETVLKYISHILMEENIEEKPCLFYDPLGLQVTEQSFYDALRQKYPPSPNQYHPPPYHINHNVDSPDDVLSGSSGGGDYGTSSSSCTSTSSDPQILAQNIFTDSESVLQFRRGLEEASKFLPGGNQLGIDLESSRESKEEKGERENLQGQGSRGRKNHGREDIDLEEGRNSKQSAVYVDENELSEMFDDALSALCVNYKSLRIKASQASQSQPNLDLPKKGHSKKQGKKKDQDTVDLSTLLIQCAQAVAVGDSRISNELLKQIRQHSSPFGDGSQRLAHFFANGLEARLAGTGTGTQMFYACLASKRVSASEILKAYKVHLSACPFKRIILMFAVKMICKVAEKATSLHIVDFGIGYGVQWPILIQKLAERPGGPPKLRITGIEHPQPGFRPTEEIDETGRRLAMYCERYNVPFEYHAIASNNWETIKIEELKIDRNEMLAVNSLICFKNLLDETVEETSPRNAVLRLIRTMKPDIFVHSIVNGSYNAPFFVTRFKEALFHFSALYDTFDVTISRENPERLMFEREIYGREAMNVIACEGLERVERPETYKQWQARTMRAGFRQLPLDRELVNACRSKLKEIYHKDFVVDEDSRWLLQGWKGRIVYASSCWAPA